MKQYRSDIHKNKLIKLQLNRNKETIETKNESSFIHVIPIPSYNGGRNLNKYFHAIIFKTFFRG